MTNNVAGGWARDGKKRIRVFPRATMQIQSPCATPTLHISTHTPTRTHARTHGSPHTHRHLLITPSSLTRHPLSRLSIYLYLHSSEKRKRQRASLLLWAKAHRHRDGGRKKRKKSKINTHVPVFLQQPVQLQQRVGPQHRLRHRPIQVLPRACSPPKILLLPSSSAWAHAHAQVCVHAAQGRQETDSESVARPHEEKKEAERHTRLAQIRRRARPVRFAQPWEQVRHLLQ